MADCRLPDYRLPDYRRRKNISKSTRSISGRDEYTILFNVNFAQVFTKNYFSS